MSSRFAILNWLKTAYDEGSETAIFPIPHTHFIRVLRQRMPIIAI